MDSLQASMTFNWPLLLSVVYTASLGLLAVWASRGNFLRRLLHGPIIYVLGCTAGLGGWMLVIMPNYAYHYGFNFTKLYLGLGLLFLIAPILIAPMLRLVKTHQLHSLADLMAFRFQSRLLGGVVTLILLLVTILILALQLMALEQVLALFGGGRFETLLIYSTVICLLMFLHHDIGLFEYSSNKPLMLVVAFQCLVKMAFLFVLAGFCLWGIFGGWSHFHQWLAHHPEMTHALFQPLQSGVWEFNVLIFGLATLVMPHIFQSVFVENTRPTELNTAQWGVPLLFTPLLVVIPLILWSALASGFSPDRVPILPAITTYFHQGWLNLFYFLAVLSAISSVLMLSLHNVSGMTFSHLLVGFYKPSHQREQLTDYVKRRKYGLMLLLSVLVAGVYFLIREQPADRISKLLFTGLMVILPNFVGALFWSRANAKGAIFSLMLGLTCWILLQMLPFALMDEQSLNQWFENDHHNQLLVLTVLLSILGLIAGSLAWPQSLQEIARARECSLFNALQPGPTTHWSLTITSIEELERALTQQLGRRIALQQVTRGLQELEFSREEQSGPKLIQLRERILFNLSAVLGPALAQHLMDRALPYQATANLPDSMLRHSREQELDKETARYPLVGTAAELDELRRFHHQTLYELPIGVCSVDASLAVIGWNRAMTELTGFNEDVIGWYLGNLPAPWGPLLLGFATQEKPQWYRQHAEVNHKTRLFNLQKSTVGNVEGQSQAQQVLILEDITQVTELESQLRHQERLADIGRLVAGVAHEIGNPVTGIAGIAQNLEADFADPEIQDSSQQILQQTDRIRRIVSALVGYARTDKTDQDFRQALNLHQVVAESFQLIRLGRRLPLQLINAVDRDLYVFGYVHQLNQVFVNLLSNAIDATESREDLPKLHPVRIHVSASTQEDMVYVEVEDDGIGLPNNAKKDTLFDPFVTTKPVGQGTGLGLSLVQGIIRSHGGDIQLIDKQAYNQGQGVVVHFSIPRAPMPQETP